MIFEEMLREEKLEGRLEATKENILELLEDLGEIPDGLRDKIAGLEELEDLKVLHKIAASAHSLYAFEEEAEKYLQSKAEKDKNRSWFYTAGTYMSPCCRKHWGL